MAVPTDLGCETSNDLFAGVMIRMPKREPCLVGRFDIALLDLLDLLAAALAGA